MREIHLQVQAAVTGAGAQNPFSDLNREFHLTPYRVAGSPIPSRGRLHRNAASPVIAWPTTSVCISTVPS